jgi:hypothetical protein
LTTTKDEPVGSPGVVRGGGIKVALVQCVSKLEKKVALQTQVDPLEVVGNQQKWDSLKSSQ